MDDEFGDLITVCQSIVLTVFILFVLNSDMQITGVKNLTYARSGMEYVAGIEYGNMIL